jgi:hypothetical protein
VWAFSQWHSLKSTCDWREAGSLWRALPINERDFVNALMFEFSRDLAEIHALPKEGCRDHRTGPTVPPALGPGGKLKNLKECPTHADEAKG